MIGYGAIEFQYEEIILFYLHCIFYMSGQSLCVFPLRMAEIDLRMINVFIPRRPVLQVDQDGGRVGLMERISMQGYVSCRSQFRFYFRFVEFYGVVAGNGVFVRFGESASVSIPASDSVSCNRHDEDIAQIHASRAVEMSLSESPDDGIRIHVFGAIPPTDSTCHGGLV